MLPVTSLLSIGFRSAFITIPLWQIGASFSIQILAALGALWLAARSYRLGMLRYGKRLRLNELLPKKVAGQPQTRVSHV
jgi:ABC-2 type transport system permease protein